MISTITNSLLGLAKIFADSETDNPKKKREIDLILSKGSMNKFLSQYILEPQVNVSEKLKGHKHMKDIESALAEIFVSTTKQAFDVLLSVYGFDAAFAIKMLSSKDFYSETLNMESEDGVKVVASKVLKKLEGDDLLYPLHEEVNRESSPKGIEKVYRQIALTANVKNKKTKKMEEINIKVLVAIGIKYVSSSSIINLIETGSDKYDFWSRKDDWLAGEISLFNLIFANDLVRKYKRKVLKDKDEIIKALEVRERSSAMKLVSNQALGFARYYQMLVVDAQDREMIEKVIGGSLDKQVYRDKALENSKTSTLVVMDDRFEMAEFYLHNFTDSITVQYKSLKGDKDGTSEVLEFLLSRNY